MNPITLFAALLSLILGVGCGKKEPELTPGDTANRPGAKPEAPKMGYEFTVEFNPQNNDARQVALTQENTIKVLKRRLSHMGIKHFKVKPSGTNLIVIQIADTSQSKREEIKRNIQRVASLRFQLVAVDSQGRSVEYQPGIIVPGSTNLTDKFIADDGKQMERQMMVGTKVQMGGEHVTRAFATRDPLTGAPVINFSLDATGAGIFQDVTSRNIGRGLAIVLVDLNEDGSELHELISAPTIQSAIGARGEITGIDTHSEAREIANVLENPLSTPLKIIEERDVVNTDNLDGNNGHSSNLVELLPPVGPASVIAAWFFTPSDPSAFLQHGQGGTISLTNAPPLLQRGQGGATTVGQQQVLIGAAVQFWQRTGQLPRHASRLLGAADLDGDGNRDVEEIWLRGAIRQDLLERVVELDIQFDDDAINSVIREQLSYPQGQFQQKTYDQLTQSFGEADLRQYFHDELAIRHLHQVMGLGGGMVSRRAIRPLIEQSLLKYKTEVAVFRASEYTDKVTNVTERLVEYYTNNKATYKEDDRIKFAWLKISIPTNAANQTAIKQARQYQAAVYQGFQQNGTNLTVLSQIAANLQPPLKIERIELGENDMASPDSVHRVSHIIHNAVTSFSTVPMTGRTPTPAPTPPIKNIPMPTSPKVSPTVSAKPGPTTPPSRELGLNNNDNDFLTLWFPDSNRNFSNHPLKNVLRQVQHENVGDVRLPVIRGPDGLYFAGVEGKVEGSLPEFKNLTPGRSNEVRQAFLEEETQKLARDAGRAFYTNLTTALTKGNQTFDKFCRANKVEVFTVPLFSSITPAGPAYAALTNRVELPELQRAVRGMDPSKQKIPVDRITDFNPNQHGGWILNLKQRVPAAPEEITAELNNGIIAQRRRGLGQSTQPHPVRNFSQQGFQMADPTWSLREEERIKLELYIAAKKDRSEEIEKELEALGNQLLNLTRRGNPNAAPAELVRHTQQMDALRQQRRQLAGEREIISQAKTRLKELQQDKSKLHPFTPQKKWNKTAAKKAGSALEATNVAGRQTGVVLPDSYRAVMNQHPNSSAGRRAWLLWARGLLDAGDYEEAQKQFDEFLFKNEKSPMAPGAELGRALCLDKLNKKDEARAEYTKIIEKYPGQLVAQYATINLAALHQEDGLLEEARDLYKHLVDSDLTFFERRRPMRFMGSQRLTGNLARSLIVALLEKNPQLRPERSNPPIPPTVPTVPKSNTTKLPDNNGIAPQLKAPPLKARDTKGVEKSK